MPWIHPVLTVLAGYLVLGITGFGSALIVVPLLAWRWPLPEVVALTLLMDAPASALLGGLNLKQVDRGELRRLLPGMAGGAVVGLLIADVLPARWPLAALGLYVAVIGLRALQAPGGAVRLWSVHWAPVAGGLAGLVQMVFGAAGPVFLSWLQHRPVDVRAVRATVPAVMLLAIAAVLAVKGLAGQLSSPTLWQRWLVLVGVAVLAVALGHRLSRHVPTAALRRGVCALLVCSGLMLVWRALR
jgi:uncharacterized membrane protein YfcA